MERFLRSTEPQFSLRGTEAEMGEPQHDKDSCIKLLLKITKPINTLELSV